MTPRSVALRCGKVAAEVKANDIIVLDVKRLTSLADYFVICSGTSDRHMQSISDAIRESLQKKKIIPLGIEGYREALWILMDYYQVIVHIFHERIREVYELEKLWSDAPRVSF